MGIQVCHSKFVLDEHLVIDQTDIEGEYKLMYFFCKNFLKLETHLHGIYELI